MSEQWNLIWQFFAFRHFGRVYLVFGTILHLLWVFVVLLNKFSIVVGSKNIGQRILEAIWSYCRLTRQV